MSASTDEGQADSRLEQARRRFERDSSPEHAAAVRAALLDSRLLVPVVVSAKGRHTSKETTMALVTLAATTGATAAVAFSSWLELKAWADHTEIDARPVPIAARELLAAVVAQRCEALVLDPASRFPLVLAGSDLTDLAAGYLAVAGAPGITGRAADGVPRPERWQPSVELSAALAADPAISEAWSLVLGPSRAAGAGTRVLGLLLAKDAVPVEVASRLAAVLSSEVDITLVSAAQVARWRRGGFRPLSAVASVSPLGDGEVS